MYPYLRVAREIVRQRHAPRLEMGETHVSHHICWPWDIDVYGELNNGRTLTLYDLGRFALFKRSGFLDVGPARGWTGAVAGVSVRYRKRIHMFQRIEMRSRFVGWDAKFSYCEQGFWRGETCHSHALLRLAVTGREGIVPPSEVAEAMGYAPESPAMPDWIHAWIEADAARPWPPMAA